MRQIIIKDEKSEHIIDLYDVVNIDAVYYKLYRLLRTKRWFRFDARKLHQMEKDRLAELLPELQHFAYGGKIYMDVLNGNNHVYTLEFGSDHISMVDKLISNFYRILIQKQFNVDTYEQFDEITQQMGAVRLQIGCDEKILNEATPGSAEYIEAEAKVASERKSFAKLLEQKRALRNPYWVPGLSSNGGKIMFSIFKPGAKRSSCNIAADDCAHGIPIRVKQRLLNDVTKNPNVKFILKMYLPFDYSNSVADGDTDMA